jgi:hypothetical protein
MSHPRGIRLMRNHGHAIVTPNDEAGLRRSFGDLHRRTTGQIHARCRWTRYLRQTRFGPVAMDAEHRIAANASIAKPAMRRNASISAETADAYVCVTSMGVHHTVE